MKKAGPIPDPLSSLFRHPLLLEESADHHCPNRDVQKHPVTNPSRSLGCVLLHPERIQPFHLYKNHVHSPPYGLIVQVLQRM